MSEKTATEKLPEKSPNAVFSELPDLGDILNAKPGVAAPPTQTGGKKRTPKAEARAAREETARVMFSRAVVALDACVKRLNEKTARGEVLTRDENRALNQALYAVRNIIQWR